MLGYHMHMPLYILRTTEQNVQALDGGGKICAVRICMSKGICVYIYIYMQMYMRL